MSEDVIRLPIEIDTREGLVNLGQLDNAGKKVFSDFSKGGEQVGKSIGHITAASQQAKFAAIDLSHVVRDLPFAISNPAVLTGPFDRMSQAIIQLKAETGSFKGALGALTSQLAGGTGLLIGISLVSSALAIFGEKIFGSSEGTKKAAVQIDSLGDSLAKFGADAAANSVAELQKYKVALTDLDVPMSQRVKALQEYNKEADKSNQLSEADLNNIGKVNTAIDTQIQLLERRALIRGAEQKLVELYKVIFDNEFKLENAISQVNNAQEKQKQLFSQKITMSPSSEEVKKFTEDIFNLTKAATGLGGLDKVQQLQFPIDKARQQVKDVLDFIDEQIKKGVDFGGVFKGVKIKAEDVDIVLGTKKTELPEITLPTLKIKVLSPQFNLLGSAAQLEDLLNKKLSPEETAKKFIKLNDALNGAKSFDGLVRAAKAMGDFEKSAGKAIGTLGGITEQTAIEAELLDSALIPAFDDLFTAIANGENPVKAFFKGVEQAIEGVIKKLIEAAIEAEIFTLLTGGGGAGFISAFKDIILGHRAGGGSVIGGGAYVVGEKGPELFVPGTSGTIIPNGGGAGAGGSTQNIVVTGRLRNRDIVLGSAREGRLQRRVH
jgi:hypothetical protein